MAAELVGGAILGTVLSELIKLTQRAYRCKGACKILRDTLRQVQPLLDRFDNSDDLKNPQIKEWLVELHKNLEEGKDCLEDTMVRFTFKGSFKYVKRRLLASRILDTNHRIHTMLSSEAVLVSFNMLQEIGRKVDGLYPTLHVIDPQASFEVQNVPSHIVAFENNPFKKLKDSIMSIPLTCTSKTIGLRGIGGVGKTLLAKMANNDEEIKKKFGAGSILWVTIGQDVSISSVYERMGKFLADNGVKIESNMSGRNLEDQRTYLMEAFKGKKTFVIFDDIWGNCKNGHAVSYWLDICHGVGSATLITTRDKSVLDRVGAMERIEIGSLSGEESWRLFSFHAFQSIIPPSEVKGIAMEICNECMGLPLALEVIGGALFDTKDVRGWKCALRRLKRCESLTSSTTMEEELFDRLKFSYDALSVEAKKCFLYFATFPEDYRVPSKVLCSIWEAEKLFGPHDFDDTLDTGWMNLITLADRSLIHLEDDGEHARIHDVVRDLAMRIIRDAKSDDWAYGCQFEPGKVFETFPRIKSTTKRVSFIGAHVKNYDLPMFIEGYNVQTSLLSGITAANGCRILTSCLRDLCSSMTHLQYLTLSGIQLLKEVHEDMRELKSLTHLDLYGCSSLKKLPKGIKESKFLTYLDLSECRSLKELPEGIKELKSLMYLDLSGCRSLKELPEGIKELTSLTRLDLSECSFLKELPGGIKELKFLTYLHLSRCRSLKELPEGIKELKFLTYFNLRFCSSLKELLEGIKELKSLTYLDLSWCSSLKELPEGIKELKFLTYLDLKECSSLKELPRGMKDLTSLMHLYLSGCSSLEELPEGMKELKSLTYLDLSGCSSLKELPEGIKELKSHTHVYISGYLS